MKNTGLRIVLAFILFASIYGYISDDDYHKTFNFPHVIKYNCNVLIGGWHPDAPQKAMEECRNLRLEKSKSQDQNETTTNQK
jgi:hypothetical protein